MSSLRTFPLVVAVIALATLAAACGAGSDDEATVVTTTVNEAAPAAPDRPPAPAIAGVSLEGERIALADFRGRPVLINVWSSWWSTCQSEAVAYAEFTEHHPEVAYLGLDVADTPEEGRDFVDRYGWSWTSIQDPERERARRLGADYQPHFILVDAKGRIVDTWEGRGDKATWAAMLAGLP